MRAPRLSPEERRKSIIRATLPLLAEHGLQINTKQIATACGVAEGTLFKVFDTKDELINETIAYALSPHQLIARISELPANDGLHQLMVDIIQLLLDDLAQKRALLHVAPIVREEAANCPTDDRVQAKELLIAEIAKRIADFKDELRVVPGCAAGMLFGLTFSAVHPMSSHPALTPESIVDILTRGIQK